MSADPLMNAQALAAIVASMQSEADYLESRRLDSHAALLRAYIPRLDSLTQGVAVPVGSDMTTGAAARRLGWTPATVARKATGGSFTSAYTLTDGTWRIPPASVDAFIERRRHPRTPAPTMTLRREGLRVGNSSQGFDRAAFVAPFRSSNTTD